MTDKELSKRAKICGTLVAQGHTFKEACEKSGYPFKDNPGLPIAVELEMERVLDEMEAASSVTAASLLNELMDIAQLAKKKERFADAVSALRSVAEMKRLIGPNAKHTPNPLKGNDEKAVPQRSAEDDEAYADTKIIAERFNRLET